MKITAIEKAKGERYTVYVDDEYWYILDAEIILQNHLRAGMETDEDELFEIKHQAERRKGRERAYYLLSYRDHSSKELYDKLLKSISPEIASEVVALMLEQGLLDDEKYAAKLARYYLEQKKWGKHRAMQELRKKGIVGEQAQNALDECEVDTTAQIISIIEKKYYDCLQDYRGRQKLIAALMRLGYSYDDIKSAIAAYSE